MTVQHLESLYPDRSEWSSRCEQLRQAITLPDLVWMALQRRITICKVGGGRGFWRVYRQCFAHCAIGSGMIESACKWLIQQRFKGVGMRWSEDGFNHLLHLRLDWVNHRFDSLFAHVSIRQIDPSHNC